MSCKLSRRNFPSGSKVGLLTSQPLPEPADSPERSGSADSWDSCLTNVPSTASRCNKEDDFYWHQSTGESSLLGQSSSSFMSWADDMEQGMTEKIQQLLDEIDCSLYGEGSADSLHPDQAEECEQWKEKFPHLRVVGHGLPTPDCSSVCVPSEVEEVIASHGCCENSSDACLSEDRSDCYGRCSREEEDIVREKLLQSVKDKVCTYVWSEVSKRLSEHKRASHLSPDISSILANRDSISSTKQPSEHGGSENYLGRGLRAHSLPRRVPLGALRVVEKSDRHSAHNLPLLTGRQEAKSWKLLDGVKPSSSKQQRGGWSRHVTLPPIENMQITAKVTPSGRRSPGVFGEKTNNMKEHCHVDNILLVAPKTDWRHRETSAAVQATTTAYSDPWSRKLDTRQDGSQKIGSSRNEVYEKYIGSDHKRTGHKNSSPCKKSAKLKREKSQKHSVNSRPNR